MRLVTAFSVVLAALTLSMLRGDEGRLARWWPPPTSDCTPTRG